MPPRTQHPLVHVLLPWITILTVVQVVFIALFFTNGHMASQNTRAEQADLNKQTQANNASSSSDRGPLFGRMLSFTAKQEGTAVRTITWISTNGLDDLVSSHKNILTLQKDGYYFLNLRVTLDSFSALTPLTVRLCNGGKRLLEGPINPHTNSTGPLGKAQELTAQTELSVSIDPQPVNIKYPASVTHLDIIYMPKPRKNQS